MLFLKRFLLMGIVFITSSIMVMGQSTSRVTTSSGEMSVEQSYLQESIELMIIREQSRAESRDMKFVALDYIEDAISRGNTGEEIRMALEYLTMEGIVNKSHENGRLMNNYPDVRMRAAAYLGELGSPEAKDTLIKLILADNEPSVITEAIKSLAKIGLNDNNESLEAISWILARFNALNPNDLMAFAAFDAYEKLAVTNNGITDPSVIRMLILIAEDGRYQRPVRDRARQVLADLRRISFQNSQP